MRKERRIALSTQDRIWSKESLEIKSTVKRFKIKMHVNLKKIEGILNSLFSGRVCMKLFNTKKT